jgi:hypothetical protein
MALWALAVGWPVGGPLRGRSTALVFPKLCSASGDERELAEWQPAQTLVSVAQ